MNCAESIFSARAKLTVARALRGVSESKPKTNMPWTWILRLPDLPDGVTDLLDGLVLLHLLQGLGIDRLEADVQRGAPACGHEVEQLRILRDVGAHLRGPIGIRGSSRIISRSSSLVLRGLAAKLSS